LASEYQGKLIGKSFPFTNNRPEGFYGIHILRAFSTCSSQQFGHPTTDALLDLESYVLIIERLAHCPR